MTGYACSRCGGALAGPADSCWCTGPRLWGSNARRLIEGRRLPRLDLPAAPGNVICAGCSGQVRVGSVCLCGQAAPPSQPGRGQLTGAEALAELGEMPPEPGDPDAALRYLRRRYAP